MTILLVNIVTGERAGDVLASRVEDRVGRHLARPEPPTPVAAAKTTPSNRVVTLSGSSISTSIPECCTEITYVATAPPVLGNGNEGWATPTRVGPHQPGLGHTNQGWATPTRVGGI
jgi:hypothetical protein